MKLAIALMISLVTFSAFAGGRSPSDTISRIETDNNVRCDLVKNGFSVCIGAPREVATCRYSKTYSCYGIESFKVKLKVKDYYNYSTDQRETVVTSIKYL